MTEVESYEGWVYWLKREREKYVSEASMARDLGMRQPTLNRILGGKRKGMRVWRKWMEARNG